MMSAGPGPEHLLRSPEVISTQRGRSPQRAGVRFLLFWSIMPRNIHRELFRW
jgi:hypothetical protein